MTPAAASAPVPEFPVPDPSHPGWEDLRRAVTAAVQIVTLNVQEMRHALPTDDVRTEIARQSNDLLAAFSARLASIVLDEAILAERESRAYDAGFAAGLTARRCGPHRDNPGHLRPVNGG